MRIQAKFTLIVVPLIVVPMVVVAVLAYLALSRSTEAAVRLQVQQFLEGQAREFRAKADSAYLALKTLADDELLARYLLTDAVQVRYGVMQQPLMNKFAAVQRANPLFYEIRLLLPDGYEEVRVALPSIANVTEEEGKTHFFDDLSADIERSEVVVVNPDTETDALVVTIPVVLRDPVQEAFTEPGRLRGYLSITQDISGFLNTEFPPPWDEGALLITDEHRDTHSVPARIAAFTVTLTESTWLHEPGAQGWREHTVDGRPLRHFSVELNDTLRLHAILPEEALLGPSHQVGVIVVATSLAALLISIPLMLWLLRRQYVNPIQSLNQALQSVENAREAVRLSPRSKDELGELMTAFNRMGERLDESSEQIRRLAFADALTGLPNRLLFQKNLKRALANAERDGKLFALLFIDLDNFKGINDSLGHHAGDELLKEVARRLEANLRAEDTSLYLEAEDLKANFARLGGDEFTALIPNLSAPHQAGAIAERILASLAEAVDVGPRQVFVGASIGIALWPNDAKSLDELVQHADLAMYQAKSSGKNGYRFYSHADGESTRVRLRIEQRLRSALQHGGFRLHYQPIIDAATLNVEAYEALLRWDDEELGEVEPRVFIPIAEENGLIVAIGQWVVNEALRQLSEWRAQGYSQVRVGINLSSRDLAVPDLPEELAQKLHKHQLSVDAIYIEITESAFIGADPAITINLERLRQLGIQVALDDFGTGYSSLSYLRRFPVDILKIDRCFLEALDQGNNGVVLASIIALAAALQLKIVAEGVETEEQLAFLRSQRAMCCQGFLFSPALRPQQAIVLFGHSLSPGRLDTGARLPGAS